MKVSNFRIVKRRGEWTHALVTIESGRLFFKKTEDHLIFRNQYPCWRFVVTGESLEDRDIKIWDLVKGFEGKHMCTLKHMVGDENE
jgi:hypothetical protein